MHHTRYKPHFCRYRFNINHQIEPRVTYSNTLCKDCSVGNIKPSSPELSVSPHGESKKKDRCKIGADENLKGVDGREVEMGEEEGESEWKQKLRNKQGRGREMRRC